MSILIGVCMDCDQGVVTEAAAPVGGQCLGCHTHNHAKCERPHTVVCRAGSFGGNPTGYCCWPYEALKVSAGFMGSWVSPPALSCGVRGSAPACWWVEDGACCSVWPGSEASLTSSMEPCLVRGSGWACGRRPPLRMNSMKSYLHDTLLCMT